MENLGAAAQGFAETAGAHRQDHEFLDIEVVVGMRAAIDHIHHRHRHLHRAGTTKIAIKRQAGLLGSGLGHRHRHGKHGVGAQARLVLGAVQINQSHVDETLLFGVKADDGFRYFRIDVLDRLHHSLAQVAGGVAIAQFDGFPRTGTGARGHSGTAHDTGLK